MTRRSRALVMVGFAVLLITACGVSFADAAAVAADLCGPGKGWGPAKVDTPASAQPLVDVPVVPVTFIDLSAPALRRAGLEPGAQASPRVVLVQPRAPRAPPLA